MRWDPKLLKVKESITTACLIRKQWNKRADGNKKLNVCRKNICQLDEGKHFILIFKDSTHSKKYML